MSKRGAVAPCENWWGAGSSLHHWWGAASAESSLQHPRWIKIVLNDLRKVGIDPQKIVHPLQKPPCPRDCFAETGEVAKGKTAHLQTQGVPLLAEGGEVAGRALSSPGDDIRGLCELE